MLQKLSFSTANGAIARGDRAHISIDSRWDKDSEAFHLQITCLGLGHRQVDWEGIPLIIEPSAGTKAPTFATKLDRRGQSVIRGLPAGEYGILVSTIFSRINIPIDIPNLAPEGLSEQIIAKGRKEQKGQKEILSRSYTSRDSCIDVTSKQKERGITSLEFETRLKELEGATIRFFFTAPSGKVLFRGEETFSRARGGKHWSADWKGKLETVETCELVCQVTPKE